MGGGYAPVAGVAGVGFRIDSDRFLLDAAGEYDSGHKTNDNDQPNPNGHDRTLAGSAYYRHGSKWFFGGGARWDQLSTTNYSKSAWRPTIGGGMDYFRHNCAPENCLGGFSMQMSVDYITTGSDWQNGSHGPQFTVYIPSPSLKGHIFLREELGIYRIHETVTDRTNIVMTGEQTSDHAWDSFLEVTIMCRF